MNISIVHIQGNTARSLTSVRSGSFVFFTVKENKGHDLFTVSLNGRIIQVRSTKALISGMRYKAEFIKLGNKIELRIIEPQTFASKVLKNLSLPFSNEMRDIITALINSGNNINMKTVSALKKGMKHIDKKDSAILRLLAVMMDKRIPLTKDTVTAVYGFAGFQDENTGNNKGKHNSQNESKNENEVLQAVSEESLRKYVLREDTKDTLLKYFNHRRGERDNWIIIPLKYRTDKEYSGTLKINMDSNNRLLGFNLSVQDRAYWEFMLKKESNELKMSIFSSDGSPGKKINPLISNLREKLHKKGIRIDDIKRDSSLSDGFNSSGDKNLNSIDKVI